MKNSNNGTEKFVCHGDQTTVEVSYSPNGVQGIQFLAPSKITRISASTAPTTPPWAKSLKKRLNSFLAGRPVDFNDVPIDLNGLPDFRRKALVACRRLKYGEKSTYAQLARRIGSPGAARAVGSAMSHNPIPIIIPCHRVLRSDGRLGGFSAPGGTALKQQLLDMEKQLH